MERNSRIEYETDQIKDQNSFFRGSKSKFSLRYWFLTILGLSIYIIKTKKTKNRVFCTSNNRKLMRISII
jgi:hypothetical protein